MRGVLSAEGRSMFGLVGLVPLPVAPPGACGVPPFPGYGLPAPSGSAPYGAYGALPYGYGAVSPSGVAPPSGTIPLGSPLGASPPISPSSISGYLPPAGASPAGASPAGAGQELIGDDILGELSGGGREVSFDKEIVSPWGNVYNPMTTKTEADEWENIDRILDSLTAGGPGFGGPAAHSPSAQVILPETAEDIHLSRKILSNYAEQVEKSLRNSSSPRTAASAGIQIAPPRNFNLIDEEHAAT
ncbi:hypothetical protein GNI_061120 [Gregarina niphandrodes]|uniref:Uncharacterized protein n=1 Tax=Gregarina niphandrodes TaxID=110365 RepID=A0A023B896_GRENI|nr:hypothetical protein GNI_061120 [Gregarina niphandrodes]EZG68844.1 hypothetical protein GNI_061120 [Gregarina niphandrodes]|eukprot:XP_011134538.1 hypothetical protein GNI_061120 [Gregarina niphandrodes]